MPNMSMKKNPMPSLEPNVRNKIFSEVATGYTAQIAQDEAQRCLGCKTQPCVNGCPVGINIPAFLKKAAEGDFDEAYNIISCSSSLPAVCGRVCPQEKQCEALCTRGIKGESVAIGRVERFVADYHNNQSGNEITRPVSNGHRAAIVGSGPAGLTCAGDLAKAGCDVTVFEALHVCGGVLVYGIPEFRLPKSIVAKEIDSLKALGVKFETDSVIGKILSIDELFEEGFETVFLGTGAGLPSFMHIPGESLNGVCSANEFLTRINLMKAYQENSFTPVYRAKTVAVVGAGNVAMDAARCALRLGAEKVYIVYRRSEKELPARAEEVEHAREEGVDFRLLTNPVEILGNEKGEVTAIRCVKMTLGEPDASGRRRPIPEQGSEFDLPVDSVIMSIGTSPNPLIRNTTPDMEFSPKGGICADENGSTSKPGVFAGGDAVTGAATVILAMGAGKKAAAAMLKYMDEKKN